MCLLACVGAWAFDVDGICYDILSQSERTACVGRQTDTERVVGDVVIPRQVEYQGTVYTVTEISGWAFSDCRQMTSISIPATIQRIGTEAFYLCYGLQAVHLEDISSWCRVCQGNGSEDNPIILAHHVFVNGEEVKELVIPEGVTAIADRAFQGATDITSLVIPSTVEQIGASAFGGCSSLKTLSLAQGLKVICNRAFHSCGNLLEVTIPQGTERIENGAFYGCMSMTDIHLPQSLKTIGNFAFEACNSLTVVEIPDQVTTLGGRAFYECEKLTSVKLSDNITEIGDWTFTRCRRLKDINIPKNLKRLGEYALFWCSSIEELNLPSTLTDISNAALFGCQGLKSITVEEGNPKYLSDNGVLFNHAKTSLMLFPAQCDMTSYDVPSTVTNIATCAFSGSRLERLTLPQALKTIGGSVFSGMTKLESITIPPSVTTIGSGAFKGCPCLKEIEIPASVQSIGTSAFAENTALVKAHLPEGLKRIEGWLFDGCTNLNEVNMPVGLNYIGMAAFRDCSSLPAFHIPQGVTSIDAYAFQGCSTPTALTIPEKVEDVGWDAFLGCRGLEEVTIGGSVTALKGGTFYECDNIKQVWSYIENPFDVNDYTIIEHDNLVRGKCFPDEVTNSAVLYVPQGTTESYRSKTGWRDFIAIREFDPTGIEALRPIIEEGKVWVTGVSDGDFDLSTLMRSYTIVNDTIIGFHQCKKLMCKEWFCADDPASAKASYVGALYEDGLQTNLSTYFIKPGSETGILLYDFNYSVDDEVLLDDGSGYQASYTVVQKAYSETERFKGLCIQLKASAPPGLISIWMEGVGNSSSPLINILGECATGREKLLSCTVHDEVLYYDENLIMAIPHTDDPSEVKKNWLDFTHTVKTKPKAPEREVKSDRMKSEKSNDDFEANSDEETVTGEYSVKELFVNFKTLAGPYTITVTDAAGDIIYNKVVQTSNVVALNTDISTYPKGSYTITVENEEEMYTAEFSINDEDGLTPNPSPVGEGGAGAVYDLSGRLTLNNKSKTFPLGGVGRGLSKGIYIINGQKVVVR